MNYNNKKIFVTGASRGIGKAIAKIFRDNGAWVIGTSTSKSSQGGDICNEWVTADFLDIKDIKSCADIIGEISPDVLVNNAGINKIAPFIDIPLNDFQSIQQVNVIAPFLLCQAAIPAMVTNNWGRIINISSIWGKISKKHRAAYSSSKFALDGMTLALAAEHSSNGIMANCIAPGFFDTELTRRVLGEEGIGSVVAAVPARRLGQVDEIARLALWLASDENTYMSGQNITIDGGFTRV